MLTAPRHPPKLKLMEPEEARRIRLRATKLNGAWHAAIEDAITKGALPPNAGRVARAQTQFPTSNWGYVFAGQDRIAKKLGLGVRTVERLTAMMRSERLLARRLGGDKNTALWVPCIDGKPVFPEAACLLPLDTNRTFGAGRKHDFVPAKSVVSYPSKMADKLIAVSLSEYPDSSSLTLTTIGAPLARRTHRDSLNKMPCQPILSAAQNKSVEAVDDVADARDEVAAGIARSSKVAAARQPSSPARLPDIREVPEPGVVVFARMQGATIVRGVRPDGEPAWKAGYYWYDRHSSRVTDADSDNQRR